MRGYHRVRIGGNYSRVSRGYMAISLGCNLCKRFWAAMWGPAPVPTTWFQNLKTKVFGDLSLELGSCQCIVVK